MKKETASILSIRHITLAALMTAVLCIIAPFALPLPFSPVPISFATFILYLDAYVLGPRLGTLSGALYLLLGFTGLPVFSGFSGGIGRLLGPTGGYMIGYIFLVLIGGLAVEMSGGKRFPAALGLITGTVVTYMFGTAWLSVQLHLTFAQGLAISVLPYLPGDAVKIIAAMIIGPVLKSRLKRAF